MEQTNDQWLWVIDSELVESLARHDTLDTSGQKRRVQSAALAKALSLNMEGKTDQALQEIAAAIESGETTAELYWTKAHLEFQLGHYEEARCDYEEVLKQHPNHKGALYDVALCLEKLERFEDALEAFGKAAVADPKLAEATLGQGVALLHLNRPADALAAFEHCLEVKPGHEKALYGKAVALQLLNRTEEAMQLYLKLLPILGPHPELLSNLIGVELDRGESGRAREHCEKLLKLRPSSTVALAGLMAVAMERSDFKTAVQHGVHLTRVAPESYEAWFNLGVAYQRTNRREQAGQAYVEAIKLQPAGELAYVNLGTVLQERGEFAEARKAYERALENAPNHADARWNLSIVLDKLGSPAEAEKCLEKLVELAPEREDAWFRLGYYRLVRDDYQGSIEAFLHAVAKRADWLEALNDLGLAQWRTGDVEAAKASFVEAIARHPQSADAMLALGGSVGGDERFGSCAGYRREAGRARGTFSGIDLQRGCFAGTIQSSGGGGALLSPRHGNEAGFRRSAAQSGKRLEDLGARRRSQDVLASGAGSETRTGQDLLLSEQCAPRTMATENARGALRCSRFLESGIISSPAI